MRIRSGYSFRTAYGFIEDVIKRIETPFAPLTDRGSTYGFNRWRKLCEKYGKKPIYGFEVAVTDSPNAKVMSFSHVTIIATDSLAPLNAAFELASGQFRYEALLTYNDLNRLDPSLKVMLGRRINPELLDGQRDWYYAQGPSTTPFMRQQAELHGWIPIASSDNMYPSPDDLYPYSIVHGRNSSNQTYDQHILSEAELRNYASQEAFDNRDKLAAMCTCEMRKPTLVHPETEYDVDTWCEVGAKELGVDIEDPEYKARLKRELDLIHKMNFDDYFLIIADLIQYSKKHMAVGPARGSSAGSLVCYLMGITTVDPIIHDLMFERFLDPSRTDLPDIDIDFSDQHRDMAFQYLSDKYGRSHTARLGTVSFLREKAIAKQVAGALQVPQFKFESVLQGVEANEGNTTLWMALNNTQDGKRLFRDYPELEVIERIEGHPQHHSTHAAGVIVTSEPVSHYVAVDSQSNTAEVDKKDAEDLDMLKIDALGLRQLSVFEDCLQLIGKDMKWLNALPLDDQGAFDILNRQQFSGVFQYNGRAVQQVSAAFHVETFEDMVATTSLARPGPLGAGGTDTWLKVRRGEQEVNIPHPAFAEILSKTSGLIIYQEQVMAVGSQIGGMDGARTTKLRKAVQYFGGAKGMEEFRAEYMKGALEKGVSEPVASDFWDHLLTFGAYCFNRSHAVAYSMMSYYCCYLKAHYPQEFAAGMLNHEKDPSRQRAMLKELKAEGITYVPVDAETSGLKWKVTSKGLVGPITYVKGLGAKTAQQYVRSRDAGLTLPKRAVTLLANPKTEIDSLSPVRDAISQNYPDLTAINIFSEPTAVENLGTGNDRDILLFLRLIKATPRKDEKTGGTKMTCLMEDDSGDIKVFFNGRKYDEYGTKMMDAGKVGKTLWAVKGSQPSGGGIIFCDMVRFLGEYA